MDTIIAVYAGSAVGSLTAITNKHNSPGTTLCFSATSNTTYQIAVAGWKGAKATFSLIWALTNAPTFTLQPQDWDVFMGSNVTFTAQASGDPAALYTWRRHGDADLNSVTNIAGATNGSFTLSSVGTNNTGYYSALASNIAGIATSRIAHLQVYTTQRALIGSPEYLTNSFRQIVSGITGATYIVEASTNLINWVDIETNQTTFTSFDYTITNYPTRFYRVRYQP